MSNHLSTARFLFGLLFTLIVFGFSAQAQRSVGIGTREPNENAVLQIVAPDNDQGLLIPALSTGQRLDEGFVSRLGGAENGLLVFDSNQQRFYYWMTNQWQPLLSGSFSQNAQAGEGIEIINNSLIVNTGDRDSTNDITVETLASGDLEGNFPELNIAAGAVGNDKLADDAIGSEKIADNSILPQDLSSPGAGKVLISTSAGTVFWENQSLFGITFLQQGRVYVGDSGNQPSEVDMRGEGNILVGNGTSAISVPLSGDISLSSTGNVEIQAGSVSDTKLAAASVTNEKIANAAVDAPKIALGSVDSDKIADNTIVDADINVNAAIVGTKINPDFGTQNITTTGNLNANNASFSNKVTSAPTLSSDPVETLTTKSYVDSEINNNSSSLEDGDGIAEFTYDGTTPVILSIDAGRGLGFDAGQLTVEPGAGLGFDVGNNLVVTTIGSDQIADGSVTNDDLATNAAIQVNKLESLGAGNFILGDGTTNNAVNMSGDATMNASGVVTLTANAASTLGIGTIASQNADNVTITSGTIDGTIIGNSDPQNATFINLVATNVSGNGSGLTDIDATNISSGTLNDDRLPDVATGGTYNNVQNIVIDNKGRVTSVTTTPSDRRLKTDIEPLASTLNNLNQLTAYSYELKSQNDHKTQYGLMAQELMKVYPDLVGERSDGYLYVDYVSLVPILLRAMQEQQAQIDALRSERPTDLSQVGEELERVKAENDLLRYEIDKIKAALGIETQGLGEE